MLAPTTQMSRAVGGFGNSRPPENPPPAAMMAALTPTPNAANIAVMTATRRFGDTVLIQCLWLFKHELLFHVRRHVFADLVVYLQEAVALVGRLVHLLPFYVFEQPVFNEQGQVLFQLRVRQESLVHYFGLCDTAICSF